MDNHELIVLTAGRIAAELLTAAHQNPLGSDDVCRQIAKRSVAIARWIEEEVLTTSATTSTAG